MPWIVPHQATFKVFGVGLALGLWLYSGYEQLSTVAEEVENPQRAYPRALALVVPLSIAAYFLPTLAGLASAGNWEKWHTGFFSDAARMIGGPLAGHVDDSCRYGRQRRATQQHGADDYAHALRHG